MKLGVVPGVLFGSQCQGGVTPFAAPAMQALQAHLQIEVDRLGRQA